MLTLAQKKKIMIAAGILTACAGLAVGAYFIIKAINSKHSSDPRDPRDPRDPKDIGTGGGRNTFAESSLPPGEVEIRGGTRVRKVKCKNTIKNGATIDKSSGIIKATLYNPATNTCLVGCDATGTGDPTACEAICASEGYDRFFVKDGSARCVKKLDCANKPVTSADCGQNVFCVNNSAALGKLNVAMEKDKVNWRCVPPDNPKVWADACQKNMKGTWSTDRKYCWLNKPGCMTFRVMNSDEATIVMDVQIEESALQNGITASENLVWSITLTSTTGKQQYTYSAPLVGPSSPEAVCPGSCSPCAKAGLRLPLLSEGNIPSLPANFTVLIKAKLKSDSSVVVAETASSTTAVYVKAESGSFPGPEIDLATAKRAVANLATFEGLAKGSGLSIPDERVRKQMMASGGVPYEETPGKDAILVPCNLAFCKSAASINRKFVVFAWKGIPSSVVQRVSRVPPCNQGSMRVPDIWYWVGRMDNSVTPPRVSQIYFKKGDDSPYLLDGNAIPGTTLVYQVAAILIPPGETPPDVSDGLGRVSCRSKITTIQVPISQYSDELCRQFLPGQVVGEILGSNVPVPNYAWAQNGRCVWGSGATNEDAYQNYACFYGDKERRSTPRLPSSSNFQLYNSNAERCDTVIGRQGGSKTPRYKSKICTDDLTASCTIGSKSGTVQYTCSNDLSFDNSSTAIDRQTFETKVSKAVAVGSKHSMPSGDFGSRKGRTKAYSDMVRKECSPLTAGSCVDAGGVLRNNCSSSWATTPSSCVAGDTNCTDILLSAGVRDCKTGWSPSGSKCVSNVLGDWDCSLSGQEWGCTQNREKCFAYTTNPSGDIATQPNVTCCAGHGYAVKQADGGFKCWGTGNGSGPNPCIVKSDGSSFTSAVGVWPQCSVGKAAPKPTCRSDQVYNLPTNSCVSKPTCGTGMIYDNTTNKCVTHCDPACVHGVCKGGKCICYSNDYFGPACDQLCSTACTNGVCYNSECVCNLGYSGTRAEDIAAGGQGNWCMTKHNDPPDAWHAGVGPLCQNNAACEKIGAPWRFPVCLSKGDPCWSATNQGMPPAKAQAPSTNGCIKCQPSFNRTSGNMDGPNKCMVTWCHNCNRSAGSAGYTWDANGKQIPLPAEPCANLR